MGVMVNRTMVTPTKSKAVPVTLLNTNSYNVWIWQSLLAADIVEVEHCPWDFHSTMFCDGDQVQVFLLSCAYTGGSGRSAFLWCR